jgi:hypothetical protein
MFFLEVQFTSDVPMPSLSAEAADNRARSEWPSQPDFIDFSVCPELLNTCCFALNFKQAIDSAARMGFN